ncbi:MAG TPA: Xaa-Pro peptidase family protein [Candidatus Limnocylindrales bacterium]|nr:Xaa-Pro peptidase family protein [Candidatus Limnocylindrales bacterium]
MTATARPSIPAARFEARLAAARRLVREHDLSALLVGVGADLRYLTGYVAMPLERLTMLVVTADGPGRLVVPRLERDPAERSSAAHGGLVEVVAWDETDDPHELVASFIAGRGSLAVSDTLWAVHLLRLEAELHGSTFVPGSSVTSELRIVKDADEIELLRLAAQAADRVIEQIVAGPLIGRTEADVGLEVRDRLVAEGHDAAEFAIVASGPNSASPHHQASDRVISAGEPVVLDIGGPLAGYGSDITRTVWIAGPGPDGGPDPEFVRIYGLVRDAHAAASQAARPGIPPEDVDAVARRVIADGGYGDRFIHRTGHGIGLDGHEEPYLVAGNDERLRAGMAFSIEPGVYLEGRYGVRIEDIVVCTEDGSESLNEAPRELTVVDG